ncbi:potassium channel family protein [Mastigocoleus testarum]|uniref:Potassium transporter TrkA n=1 Tax=Mastigocoleus testarum BC008 TaxID=371196 RepID=A0A0V7ZP26_9CYAN|nr:TrkA C-terminal domain-containing protein [Mastigocoleus testarum]KST66154.1 potassium transporter TrkA [Mastigocoleus testarum BC008]
MVALVSVLIAISLSLLITRTATEALALTGLSRPAAAFQARSAFTGSGFTTDESEKVMNHPVRRRIIMWLMFFGNAGIITVISSLVLTFISTAGFDEWLPRLLLLLLGIGFLWIVATNYTFNRFLTRWVRVALKRWTDLDVRDYASLLHLKGDYQVMEMEVKAGDWLANKRLEELHLRDEGIVILGIERQDETYIGAPHASTCISPGDSLILYGRKSGLTELDSRDAGIVGERAHQDAIAVQQKIEQEQDSQDIFSQKQNHQIQS